MFSETEFLKFICSSFRDSTYGEGGEGGAMSQEDNYPPGMQHQGDQNGIEPTIDQIFEGISPFLFLRLRGLIEVLLLSQF